MIPLITSSEVVALALPTGSSIRSVNITDAHILVAQQRFIVPALGRTMFDAVERGAYTKLLDEHIARVLALYSMYLALPELIVKLGSGGLAMPMLDNHVAPSAEQIREFRAQFKKRADSLLREAIQYISNNPELYPDFGSSESISGKVLNSGGVIIM